MNKENAKIKVILDTDIGDDIDDALALALLIKSREIEILGITTAYKNTEMRARLAKQLLHYFNMDKTPVYPGIPKPLIRVENIKEIPCQCDDDTVNYIYNNDISFLDFMISEIRKYPNEITLLCIGPLTNIGMLILQYPEVVGKVKEIVMMGGCYYSHYSEWNIAGDPEAASIVLSSGIPIRALGLDVTLKCRINQEHLNHIVKYKDEKSSRGYLSNLILRWRKIHNWLPVLHDPLAALSIIDNNLVRFKKEDVEVVLDGVLRGLTYNKTGLRWDNANTADNSIIQVAYEADCEKVFEIFFDRVF